MAGLQTGSLRFVSLHTRKPSHSGTHCWPARHCTFHLVVVLFDTDFITVWLFEGYLGTEALLHFFGPRPKQGGSSLRPMGSCQHCNRSIHTLCVCCLGYVCGTCSKPLRIEGLLSTERLLCRTCPSSTRAAPVPTGFFEAAWQGNLPSLQSIVISPADLVVAGDLESQRQRYTPRQAGDSLWHGQDAGSHRASLRSARPPSACAGVSGKTHALIRQLQQSASLVPDAKGATALHYACTEPRCVELFTASPERALNLSGMKLQWLAPNFFTLFPNLTSLDLSNNELTVLPQSLLRLTSVVSLNTAGNPQLKVQSTTAKKRPSVVVIVCGNGTRDWLQPDFFQEAQLKLVDARDSYALDLLLCPKAMYVVTMRVPVVDIEQILARIDAIGRRTHPPVWLVGTEAHRLTADRLAKCKRQALRLAGRCSLNVVEFLCFGPQGR